MVRKFASIALAGAITMATAPAFAQDLNVNPLGLPLIPNTIDLDPFHIFTPAPPPPGAPAPVARRHHHHHHHHFHRHHAHHHHHRHR